MRIFFETNQTGELPIILKRRNNTQIGYNQQRKKDAPAGWIGTSTQPHNSTQTLLYKTTTPLDDVSKTEAVPQHPPAAHTLLVVETSGVTTRR